jgi:radical SAM-linked protein
MFKMRILFEKKDDAAYISHLDLMKVLQRSFCRAKLPVKYSEGFNPHICMSILSPLSTGYRSRYELCDLDLTCDSMPENGVESLNNVLPDGIRVIKAYPASKGLSVAKIKFSVFTIDLEGGDADSAAQVFASPVIFEKKSKRGSKEVNMLDYIKSIKFDQRENGVTCECVLAAGDDPLNPSYVVAVLREKGIVDPCGTVRYTRTAVLDEKEQLFY